MKIRSKQIGTKLTVNLDEVEDSSQVINTIQSCADGQCACSTDEYKKVQNMEIIPGKDSLLLNIEVKSGEVIDPNCISDCLTPENQ